MTWNKYIPKAGAVNPESLPQYKARRIEVTRLRNEGKSLKEISDTLGFPSVNAVNLFIRRYGYAKDNE